MKKISIAYIGGGSKAWAQIIAKDLLLQNQICGTIKLYDIDEEAAIKNQALLTKLVKESCDKKSTWEIEVYSGLEAVLAGSDFVILSILPGSFEHMSKDVHHPESYGIWQSVGDTVGPGGYARALRLFDDYVVIGKAIEDYAPDAWVINYTNPMTLGLKVLFETFPEIKAIGCCHEVFGTQKLLAKAYCEFNEVDEIDRHDIQVNVQGINHFTWINEATYKGEDLVPYYKMFVEKYGEIGFAASGQSVNDTEVNYFGSLHKVKMNLFNRYGVIAAAGDRHLAEFIPQDYLLTPETARHNWGFELTPVAWRIANNNDLIEKRDAIIAGQEGQTLEASDEEGANIMIALSGGKPLVTNANHPNIGQAPDLPIGAIVETNIYFTGNMAKPIVAGPMKPEVAALVKAHVVVQESFAKAYIAGDQQGMMEAFCQEPSVARLEEKDGMRLYTELVKYI